MSLELSQVHRLMLGHEESVQVCTLEDRVMKLVGWRLPYVYLHRKYCVKILHDHTDITPIELLRLPIAVMMGELILEKHGRALDACYLDPENGKSYIAILRERYPAWIMTYGCRAFIGSKIGSFESCAGKVRSLGPIKMARRASLGNNARHT